MSQNDNLLARVKSRIGSGRGGYGITTADKYVKNAIEAVGKGIALSAFGNPVKGFGDVLKRAAGTLTYCGENTKQESTETNVNAMKKLLGVEPPKHSMMAIVNRLTTPREDRDGDTLQTGGARLDPKAPMLWQHLHTMPIGKMVREIEKTAELLRVASVLLDINETTHDAGILFEAGALRFSHGFIPMKFEERKGGPMARFNILEFDIVEESAVSVPSNVDAEVELFSRGKLSSNLFKSHAKAMFDARAKSMRVTDKAKAIMESKSMGVCKGCGTNAELGEGDLCSQCSAPTGGKGVKEIGECKGCKATGPLNGDGYCSECSEKPADEDKGAKGFGECKSCGKKGPLTAEGVCPACAKEGDAPEDDGKGAKEFGECKGCGKKGPLNADGQCPACAKEGDAPAAPPEDGKSASRAITKAISKKNRDLIADVLDDLAEAASMEIPRAVKALIIGAAAKLKPMVESADPETPEDNLPADDKNPPLQARFADAIELLESHRDLRTRAKKLIDTFDSADAQQEIAEEFRALTSSG